MSFNAVFFINIGYEYPADEYPLTGLKLAAWQDVILKCCIFFFSCLVVFHGRGRRVYTDCLSGRNTQNDQDSWPMITWIERKNVSLVLLTELCCLSVSWFCFLLNWNWIGIDCLQLDNTWYFITTDKRCIFFSWLVVFRGRLNVHRLFSERHWLNEQYSWPYTLLE